MKKLFLIMSMTAMTTGQLFAQAVNPPNSTLTVSPSQKNLNDYNSALKLTPPDYETAVIALANLENDTSISTTTPPTATPNLPLIVQALSANQPAFEQAIKDAATQTTGTQQFHALTFIGMVGTAAGILAVSPDKANQSLANTIYTSVAPYILSLYQTAQTIAIPPKVTDPEGTRTLIGAGLILLYTIPSHTGAPAAGIQPKTGVGAIPKSKEISTFK